MIVTVTCFPALVRGEVQRADSTVEDPGGKGVNVTRFLTAHGSESIGVLPADGPMGAPRARCWWMTTAAGREPGPRSRS